MNGGGGGGGGSGGFPNPYIDPSYGSSRVPSSFGDRLCNPTFKWNGKRESFRETMSGVESHLIVAEKQYLVNDYVVSHYLLSNANPDWLFNNLSYLGIDHLTPTQFHRDNVKFFGILKAVFDVPKLGQQIFQALHTTRDGIWTYVQLKRQCDVPLDTQRLNVDREIHTRYHPSHPGGLKGYLDNLKHAFSRLEVLDRPMDNANKLDILRNNLFGPEMEHLTSLINFQMKTNPAYTFDQAMSFLESQAEQKFNYLKTSQGNLPLTGKANLAELYPAAKAYLAHQGNPQGRRGDYNIGRDLWKALDKDLRDALVALRNERRQADHSNSPSSAAPSLGDSTPNKVGKDSPIMGSSKPLPSQYGSRANAATQVLDEQA
jgi:hypothetical protein